MKTTDFFAWLLVGAHVLLVLFGIFRWSRLDTGCRYIWAWAIVGLAARLLMLGLQGSPLRLVVTHFYLPISAVLATGALASYQSTRRGADTVRIAGYAYVIAWALLTPLVETLTNFSRFTAPLRGILIAVVAAFTIASRARVRQTRALDDRGTLIAAAFAVLYGATGVIAPYAAVYHLTFSARITSLLLIRDVIVLAAMMPMLWACMLHDRDPRRAA
ncbi:MAG: hypothetical protein V4503_00130 [Gemmatimonadota bacterium]